MWASSCHFSFVYSKLQEEDVWQALSVPERLLLEWVCLVNHSVLLADMDLLLSDGKGLVLWRRNGRHRYIRHHHFQRRAFFDANYIIHSFAGDEIKTEGRQDSRQNIQLVFRHQTP